VDCGDVLRECLSRATQAANCLVSRAQATQKTDGEAEKQGGLVCLCFVLHLSGAGFYVQPGWTSSGA
jgi:hypothetical protein